MNGLSFYLVIWISLIIGLINWYRDLRMTMLLLSTTFISIYGFFNFMQHLGGVKTYKFIICLIIIIINFAISIKSSSILAIEKMHISKRSFIFITPLFIIALYILMNDLLNSSFIKMIGLLIGSYIMCIVIYIILRELLFTYIEFWINYFFGEKHIYENKKLEIEINKTSKGVKYYYLLLDEIELELSKKAADLYCKDGKRIKLTKNILIRKSPVLKKIIVLDIW